MEENFFNSSEVDGIVCLQHRGFLSTSRERTDTFSSSESGSSSLCSYSNDESFKEIGSGPLRASSYSISPFFSSKVEHIQNQIVALIDAYETKEDYSHHQLKKQVEPRPRRSAVDDLALD